MPFGKKSCLLKYFGHSFFHDANLIKANFMPLEKILYIEIGSKNILEDINSYREDHGFAEITQKEYWRNPIIFRFRFSNVTYLSVDLGADRELIIMDTEIVSYHKRKGYEITIQFEDHKQITFFCKGTSFTLDTSLIAKYTNGLKKIPFCKNCKSFLLTKDYLTRFVQTH